MADDSPQIQATALGWLGALLVAAWGWIVKNVVIGRIHGLERRVSEIEAGKQDAAECEAIARGNDQAHAEFRQQMSDGRDRVDRAVVELRSAIDATRRELKDDLRTITELLRQRAG